MTKAVALFLALLMTAVPLAGCTGDDTVDDDDTTGDDTELNAANERIIELEAQAEVDQARIVELEEMCCTLEEMAVQYQYGYNEGYEDGGDSWYEGWEQGYIDGLGDVTRVSTLDTIIARGSMKCGVKESQYGMGYLDAGTGVRSGLDISYCRAIAAAIGLNPDTDVEYIPASGSDRFDKLASGTIDVLIRTTTWTELLRWTGYPSTRGRFSSYQLWQLR
jgi:ABC-type amino acid transport substrate-binding protein